MSNPSPQNPLYPIFLLPHRLNILVVGGGNVALEKLTSLMKNSPEANVKLLGASIFPETKTYLNELNIPFEEKFFEESDLEGINILFIAINIKEESAKIRAIAKTKNILVNVADTPDLCDFYLGSVVTKGDLKIGISTNGKSPTLSKRIREYMEEALPDSTQDLIDNLGKIRSTLTGDFQSKVEQLNAITKNMVDNQNTANSNKSSIFKRIFKRGK
jgi:precorrin-2 dehydrogenase/sirohydrochlorin ferrochelatase